MRIVSWNIRQGGGRRVREIVRQLEAWKPDFVALSEVHETDSSQRIAAALQDFGLDNQIATSRAPGNSRSTGLLVATTSPIRRLPAPTLLEDSGRWLHFVLEALPAWEFMVMHVPNRSEGDKYGFHTAVVETFEAVAKSPAIAIGDTNSGVPGVDEQAPYFNAREGRWYQEIERVGWCDVWRTRNLEAAEFTW